MISDMVNNNCTAAPLDTQTLENITSGKKEVQRELFDIFFINVEECIELMEKVCNEGSNQKWHDAAEELKNICDSLGAMELAKSCVRAESISNSNEEEKKKILTNIRSNVHKLRVYVRNTRY